MPGIDVAIQNPPNVSVSIERPERRVSVQRTTLQVAMTKGIKGESAQSDLMFYANGVLADGEPLMIANVVGAAIFATAYCAATAEVAATGTSVIAVTRKRAGVTVAWATITFTVSAVGVVAFAGDGAVLPGDKLKWTAPSPADATLADVAFTFGTAP